jgi:hypothetical protein
MKHVTFTREMRPYVPGERRVVPDEVAARLEAEGAIAPDPPDWPAAAMAQQPGPGEASHRKPQRYPIK